jgi:hypothetical protein
MMDNRSDWSWKEAIWFGLVMIGLVVGTVWVVMQLTSHWG